MRTLPTRRLVLLAALATAGCATTGSVDYDRATQDMMTASFRDQGIAKVDRLVQDASNRECSQAMGAELPADRAKAIEAENMKTIKWPADRQFIGDWREGERIAQNGRGLTWTDPANAASGGNCYNCHQIAKAEISFGTIGPSLYQYGKIRGVADPAAPASQAIVEYTWGKLYNAKAYNACSGMPRMGHAGILNEKQLKDVMALLLDPKSPVNSQ